jgi:hypothetical protein
MGLFGNKEKKAAEDAATAAEFGRLCALPRPDLAVEIMPVFGPDGQRPTGGRPGIGIMQILLWLTMSKPGGSKYMSQMEQPVREALQLLEHANLVIASTAGGQKHMSGVTPGEVLTKGASSWLNATSLGEAALAEGTVRQHL